ncbi:hypothetical protein LguiB_018807 [Lonicera macranthoides]
MARSILKPSSRWVTDLGFGWMDRLLSATVSETKGDEPSRNNSDIKNERWLRS